MPFRTDNTARIRYEKRLRSIVYTQIRHRINARFEGNQVWVTVLFMIRHAPVCCWNSLRTETVRNGRHRRPEEMTRIARMV